MFYFWKNKLFNKIPSLHLSQQHSVYNRYTPTNCEFGLTSTWKLSMSRYSCSLLLSCDKNLYFLGLLQSFCKQYTFSQIFCTHIENKQTFRYACNVSAYLLQRLQEHCHLQQTFKYVCCGLVPNLLQWFVFHMGRSQPSEFPIQILCLLSEIIKVICTRETGRTESM